MGAGKTVAGRALAVRLGWPHHDTDEILARRFGPVGDQLRRDGEPAFRAREAALVRELIGDAPCVVSTGGGVVEAPGALDHLLATARVVWLDAPLEVLAGRIGDGDRPLWDERVVERWARRRPAWARAHARVDASAPLSDVVDALARAAAPADFVHAGPGGPCPVRIAPSLDGLVEVVDAVAPGRRILVTDATVDAAWGDAVRARLGAVPTIVIPAGEAHKTVATWSDVLDRLLALRPTRDTTVLALGGGVVGDLAGFAAASALRGLPVIQLPTTLLAMVDAALGGKTAVDHPLGKNLIGAFHPPAALAAWPGFLDTLPPRERASGLAEVVKTALVGDAELFSALAGGAPPPVPELVRRCLRLKGALVERDPYERGDRILLNAGHTVGHAIERALGFGVWTHGEAVAAGLVAEARFAVARGVCVDRSVPDALVAALTAAGLPTALPEVDVDALLAAAALDKKGRVDTIRMPLPVRVGEMSVVDVPRNELVACFGGGPR
jgi:shikimate kinase/3-dehydroquinate synthase